MENEKKILSAFLTALPLTIVAYVVGLIVDENSYGIIAHVSFFLGVMSLLCSLWVAWMAYSIKSHKRSTVSLESLSSFVSNVVEPMAAKSKDGKMPTSAKLMLRNQIKNTLLVCNLMDCAAREMLVNAVASLETNECYYDDVLHTVRGAVCVATKNLN